MRRCERDRVQHSHGRWLVGMCREVCTCVSQMEPMFVGTDTHPVQIDESYLAIRRNYNRERIAAADKKSNRKENEGNELEDWRANHHDGALYYDDGKDWLWVVGIYMSPEKVRFIRVQNLRQEILRIVIGKHIALGRVV